MTTLIKNGYILDPSTKTEGYYGIFIQDGKIKNVGKQLKETGDQVIDASGMYVMTGFIDLHVHLR